MRRRAVSIGRALVALGVGFCLPGTALAADSTHYVCSAIVSYDDGGAGKIGLSIRFDDQRAPKGDGRQYTLSAIHQGKLFQGVMIDRSDKFGEGKIELKNGRYQFYVGSFRLEQGKDDAYSMVLDGKLNVDPFESKTTAKIKATLPCVDLST